MILDHYSLQSPELLDLIKLGQKEGFYGPSGWYQKGILKLGQRFGLKSYRKEYDDAVEGLSEIKVHLNDGGLVIASTRKKILGNNRFHTILLTGYEGENGDEIFYYHDPELLHGGDNVCFFVDKKTLSKEWRKMAMFFNK